MVLKKAAMERWSNMSKMEVEEVKLQVENKYGALMVEDEEA